MNASGTQRYEVLNHRFESQAVSANLRAFIKTVAWNVIPMLVAAGAVAGDAESDRHPYGHQIRHLQNVPASDGTTTIFCLDYTTGVASRVLVNQASGRVLLEEKLPGRPQSSKEEFSEAVTIIRSSDTAKLVSGGAVYEGGFIVNGPSGHPENHRYIQVRLLSPDRQKLFRVMVVDLTDGTVASSKDWFD